MPHPVLHLSLAKNLADQLALGDIDADRGAYYLGSTAPDMRRVARLDRSQTHFFRLDNFEHQDSVRAMFAAHPELGDRGKLNTATAAFLAGYMTHLVLDEGWICEVYRPLFGEKSPLSGGQHANVLDRIIQFEMDRQKREDCQTLETIRDAVLSTSLELTVGFLEMDSLLRWRDINLDFLKVPPTWERFRGIAAMLLGEYGITTAEQVDALMAEVPTLLREAVDHVGWQRIQAFIEAATQRSLAEIRDYLS
jgi:hypothetical protein